MFDDRVYEYLAQELVDLYEPIQTKYIELMGEHIRDIGKLTTTDVHRLQQIQRMKGNAREIAEDLAVASKKSVKEIEKIFLELAEESYSFTEKYYNGKGLKQVPFSENVALQRVVKAEAERTANTLLNLSQTTASQIKRNPTNYRQAIDSAVRSASMGVTDYQTAIRHTVRQAASEGLTFIDFDTGYRRRLDSQIRMNVLEGLRQTNLGVARQAGKEYGADGVEISVHGLCAPDHIDIQGRQYSNKEYDQLNSTLDRPIGTLNCRHFAVPILLGISSPTHSDSELEQYRELSEEKIDIDGKTKSRYQWSQEQRKIETNIRRQKDIAVAAKAEGDMTLRREAQAKINQYKQQYNHISKEASLELYKEKMSVSGYHWVKPFTNANGDAIINVNKVTLKGAPNSITQFTGTKGGIERNYYGSDGKQYKQIANNNHNKPKKHPFGKQGEHAHDYIYDKDGELIDRPMRELNRSEREENSDIL